MKILHVWNMAAVATVIARWQRKIGHDSSVVARNAFDAFGITAHYADVSILINTGAWRFLWRAANMSKSVDVVHLHDMRHTWLWRLLRVKKPIILHYHGTLTRDTPASVRAKWEKHVNGILVSTLDLTSFEYSKEAIYVPNPIDTELFAPRKIKQNGRGLCLMKMGQTAEHTKQLLDSHGFADVDWKFIPTSSRTILYPAMPEFLCGFEYYADINIIDGSVAPGSSVTGLQSMSLGVKTINYNFEVASALPRPHRPSSVVKQLDSIYKTARENKK